VGLKLNRLAIWGLTAGLRSNALDYAFQIIMEPEPTAPTAATPKKYLRLSDIECYRVSFTLSNLVWEAVGKWPALAQRTVGEQLIRATDSISANIA
jgi:hypothetical protein